MRILTLYQRVLVIPLDETEPHWRPDLNRDLKKA
jgi:hypothetical protein